MPLLETFNPGTAISPVLAAHLKHRIYAIIHFSINTFTDREWGYGDEAPELFNPTDFDADQIAQACVDGGLTGLILVCKHHDGFCLWPTRTTPHNISASPFRNGKGDLVREVSDACRRHGLGFGIYCSPWDRNHPAYGTPEYLEIYREQLRELYTNYGEAFELWFDGANGGDGYYGGARETRKIDQSTYYDWENTWKIARELQPHAAIFSDIGPDLRWVGNEKGLAHPDSSALFTPAAPTPGKNPAPGYLDYSHSTTGNLDGNYLIPPECDVPLRPGWFYHADQDNQVRSLPELVNIFLHSVGCGGFLNLGLAPDRRGRLHENDVARLKEFRSAVDKLESAPLMTETITMKTDSLVMDFDGQNTFNLLDLAESPEDLESTREYCIEAITETGRITLAKGKAIGLRRLIACAETTAYAVILTLPDIHPNHPLRLTVAIRHVPAELLEKTPPTEIPPDKAVAMPLPDNAGLVLEWTLPAPTTIHGFIFQPDDAHASGLPHQYIFEARLQGKWFSLTGGEFSNIQANPLPQKVTFSPAKAEAVRFHATRLVDDSDRLNCAGFSLLT